jgi:hypothetical protein
MRHSTHTTQVLTPFGSGYVSELHSDMLRGNLPPAEPHVFTVDFSAVLAVLRAALFLK